MDWRVFDDGGDLRLDRKTIERALGIAERVLIAHSGLAGAESLIEASILAQYDEQICAPERGAAA
jgi:hypothetical protein